MNDRQLETVKQVGEFLAGTEIGELSIESTEGRYAFIHATLRKFRPKQRIPIAKYTALFFTVPSSRIFTRRASNKTMAYTDSSGRLCQVPTYSSTASVTAETNSGEISVPYSPQVRLDLTGTETSGV